MHHCSKKTVIRMAVLYSNTIHCEPTTPGKPACIRLDGNETASSSRVQIGRRPDFTSRKNSKADRIGLQRENTIQGQGHIRQCQGRLPGVVETGNPVREEVQDVVTLEYFPDSIQGCGFARKVAGSSKKACG